ncbi:MAG: erythromycin esterase family protein, partial [Planctomycetota bacterium]|nr:erythromycin esterase family protein [Planctomycetota bacterium]
HAIPIAPADQTSPALSSAIGESNVVFLGEPTHADGSVFAAKIQMVKALHEHHGFDVLVFESGLHGCDAAWRAFEAGELSPVDCASEGIFPIWTRSAQMLPLWEYLAERSSSDRPLQLVGYDSQITGRASARLADDLGAQMTAAGIPPAKQAPILEAAKFVANGKDIPNWRKNGKATKRAFAAAVKKLRGSNTIPDAEFWAQTLQSLGAEAERHTLPKARGRSLAASFNPRDAIGANNLQWWVQSRFQGRKVMVWAATMHSQRNPSKIDTRKTTLDYSGVEPAGHLLALKMKVQPYVVAFVCAEGRGGLPWQTPGSALPDPLPGSFEALCLQAGLTSHLVDLRHLPPRHPLRKPMVAGPLGHSPMRASWPDSVDAFAFVRERTPSTPLDNGDAEKPSDPFDLTEAVRDEISHAVSREGAGNVWAPKWNSYATWERWRRALRPDDQALAEEERRLLLLLEESAEGGYRWRVLDVLAAVAADRGNAKVASERWSQAMDAHPPVTMADPDKHSGFQHLLNRAARHELTSKKFKAAKALLSERIAKDARARAPYVADWAAWVDSKQYDQIADTFRSSLKARKKRFPDQADAIEKRIGDLR